MTAPVTPVLTTADVDKVVRVAMQADLGNHVGISLETYIAQGDLNGAGTANKLLDDLYDAMKRQRAKGEIEALMKARAAAEKVIADYQRQMDEAEATFQADTAKLRDAIEQTNLAKSSFDAQARAYWTDSKRGDFKPDARYRAEMSKFDSDREKLLAQIKAKEAERDRARSTLLIAIGKQHEEVLQIDLDLAERNKLLSGGASE